MLCFPKVELILNNIMIKKIQSILGLKRNPNYKSLQTIVKSLKTFAVFLLGVIIIGLQTGFPEIFNFVMLGTLSVGTILTALRDYLKHGWGLNI